MMSAYSICPPSSGVGTGIVTKAPSNGGRAPYLAGAYQVFTAPPGTQLVDVTFNVGAIRLNYDWSVGIVAFGNDWDAGDYPYGCYPWNSYCGVGTPVFSIQASVNLYSHARFRFQTRCVNPSGCDLSASPFNPANRGLFSAANVTVRVRDETPPTLSPARGALWNGGWHRGREEAWTSYTDGSGIMVSRIYVDGVARQTLDYRDGSMPDWVRCDFTRPRPCVDIVPGGLDVDTSSLSDGVHRIDVEAIDAGGNAAQVGHAIQVDNSVPAKPEGTAVSGGEGWRSTNRFDLGWTNPPGQVAPIVRARYRCALRAAVTVSREPRRATASPRSRCAFPSRGNGSRACGWRTPPATTTRHARAMRSGCASTTRRPPPCSRNRTRVTRVWCACTLRTQDLGWRTDRWSCAASAPATGSMPAAASAVARLETRVDDLALPDGTYELRARVRDVAGNERTGTRRADGSPMRIVLPLRAAGRIAVDPPPCRRKQRRRCRPVRTFRNDAVVRATLTAASGPIGYGLVSVRSRPRTGGAFAPLASLRTDANGRLSIPAGSGPSRTLRFQWAGTDTAKPASADVQVLVPARSSMAVDRRRVLNGDAVTFSGRLLGRPLPDGGKLVDLQVKLRGRWRTFAAPRADSAGRWSYLYRFEATRGLVVYSFRARIRREAAYPYELGHSRTVRVTVRG